MSGHRSGRGSKRDKEANRTAQEGDFGNHTCSLNRHARCPDRADCMMRGCLLHGGRSRQPEQTVEAEPDRDASVEDVEEQQD